MNSVIPVSTYYRTLCIVLWSIVSGLNFGILGPTLVHLEYVLHTDTQGMAMAFTGDNFGTFIGAILGGIFFDRYGFSEYQFYHTFLWMGVFTSLAPWTPNVFLYCVMMSIRSFILGYGATGLSPYLLHLWKGHRFRNGIFQATDVTWSIGCFLIPLVTLPFLSDLPQKEKKYENVENKSMSTNIPEDTSIYNVRYPYMIVGTFSMIIGLMFYVAYKLPSSKQFISINSSKSQFNKPGAKEEYAIPTGRTRKLKKWLIFLVSMYTAFIVWQGTLCGTFLSVFVIKGLGWPVHKGPLITSAFRGAQGVGRFIGVPIALFLTPTQMLVINMVIGITAYCTMFCAVMIFNSEVLMWVSTIMAGMAVSNSFPTAYLWGVEYIPATAAYSSLFGASLAFGAMTSGSLAGYLFDNYTHNCVIYLLFCASVTNIVIFIIMNTTAKHYTKSQNDTVEKPSTQDNLLVTEHSVL